MTGSGASAPHGEPLPGASRFGQPMVPPSAGHAQPPQPQQEPVHGGWDGAWQDASGQWHYPYAQQAQDVPEQAWAAATAMPHQATGLEHPQVPLPQQPAAPSAPVVPAEQLAPVGAPSYLAPERATTDPRRNTLAAVIVFVSLIIALWAILGFLGSLSKTLSSVNSGNEKLKVQLGDANDGLADLDVKTSELEAMTANTKELRALLEGLDGDMGSLLTGVDHIAGGMGAMNDSLGQLDAELTKVNRTDAGLAGDLDEINGGLAEQMAGVRAMRGDVVASGGVLGTLPGRLAATNGRLAHINGVVNFMGCTGIGNNLSVHIKAAGINLGGALVNATIVPAGAWGRKLDGSPC